MAELITLARPYAKAAFEFANSTGSLQAWSTMLATAAAVTGESAVVSLLSSPSLTTVQQAEKFLLLCGDELDDKAKNFVKVLADNRRLPLLPEIHQLFDSLKANLEKSVEVNITGAFELDDSTQQTIAQALKSKLEREVKISTTVDKNLLGGIVIRAGDTVIDGSVRGRLAKLAEAMNS